MWWAGAAAIVVVAVAVIAGLLQGDGPSLPDVTPRQTNTITSRATTTTTTTRRVPQTPMDAAVRCFSAWDGNHDDFERQVRELLNDPGSMETHGTYFNSVEDISDGINDRSVWTMGHATNWAAWSGPMLLPR